MVNWKNLIVNPPRDLGYYLFKVESKDDVLDVTGRAFDKVWDLLNKCLPIGDTLNFKMNHYCEFYLAWLKNYDISSNTVISK